MSLSNISYVLIVIKLVPFYVRPGEKEREIIAERKGRKNPSHRFIYNLLAILIVFYFAVTLKRARAQISYSSNKNSAKSVFSAGRRGESENGENGKMEKLRAGKRGLLDSQTRRIATPKFAGFDSPWTVVGTWRKGGGGGIHSTKWRRIMMREYLREENSLVSVNLESFGKKRRLKYSAGILIGGERRGESNVGDEEKRKKEEKFFWNDSNLSNDNCENFLFLYAKKNLLYRGRKFVTRSFLPRIEQREKEKRGTVTRLYICIWKTRRKNTISLAIKNLVINKLIPLLSRARDFVCQLGMYKRNVAARNRCGLTAQLHSLSSSRWILFLVNELRSWISPYTFHFRGRYISLLHLVHPFPMKIIEQFRVNQTSIS